MTEQLELLCILTLRGVLFGVITSGSAIEREEFVSMVLTTFRLFASGQNLADTLYFRYTEQRPEWLTRKGKVRFEWSMAQKRMKARVATILHLWLELHWKPEDSGAIVRLQQLVGTVEEDCVFHAQSLRTSSYWIGSSRTRTFTVEGSERKRGIGPRWPLPISPRSQQGMTSPLSPRGIHQRSRLSASRLRRAPSSSRGC